MRQPPPPEEWHLLEPPDAIDRYWERHVIPLMERLQREYPELYAEAERQAIEQERAKRPRPD